MVADNRQLAGQVRRRCGGGLASPARTCSAAAPDQLQLTALHPIQTPLTDLQKQELLVALKKAGRLIDVLRRQKVCLEAAALLQVSSRELADALAAQSLDWL